MIFNNTELDIFELFDIWNGKEENTPTPIQKCSTTEQQKLFDERRARNYEKQAMKTIHKNAGERGMYKKR